MENVTISRDDLTFLITELLACTTNAYHRETVDTDRLEKLGIDFGVIKEEEEEEEWCGCCDVCSCCC